ncbi:Hypothetical protein, putative [Bodo saltans]|uniref:Uncharacterized protein n=1 Tax=Bodo saltans TaxID=75058 RepID=A0A0S4JGG2_BODSA|nr:Hypothetical protein, putative [Bodo saltans]|eukprot:CUG88535.1 Hypothetical protein, putative [Bodo saltans]
MSDDARSVWVEGADPALVSADDILDFAKIVGDVDAVKLQYHAAKKSVFYRVVFRQNSSAQVFLHLEGTRFKDCVLHLSSSVYGSIDPVTTPAPTAIDEEKERKNSRNSTFGIAADKKKNAGSTVNTVSYPLLPFFHEFSESCRLDVGLIPSYTTITQLLSHWKDPESHPRPVDLSIEEEMFLKDNYGLDVLCPLLDEFAQLHQSVGSALKRISELKDLSVKSGAAMEELLKTRPAAPSSSMKGNSRNFVESSRAAEDAKPFCVRNTVPISIHQSHPLTLLIALSTVCGPIARYEISYHNNNNYNFSSSSSDGSFASFNIWIEFALESCAARALTMLQGTFTGEYTVGKKGKHHVWAAEDTVALTQSLAHLRHAQWETPAIGISFATPTVVVSDSLASSWATRLGGE